MQTEILSNFHGVQSVITSAITARHGNCTARHSKVLQRVIKSCPAYLWNSRSFAARHLTGPGSSGGPTTSSRTSTCPQRGLFARLPSGQRYRSVKSRTTRLTNSSYPQGIRPLDSTLQHRHAHTLHHSRRLALICGMKRGDLLNARAFIVLFRCFILSRSLLFFIFLCVVQGRRAE